MDQVQESAESERLTWDEICRRHIDQWVVLVDIDWINDTDFEFGAATVIACAPRRKDASPIVKQAHETHQEVGCFYTGPLFGTDAK